jgi:Protein of unknown function (DUF4232)
MKIKQATVGKSVAGAVLAAVAALSLGGCTSNPVRVVGAAGATPSAATTTATDTARAATATPSKPAASPSASKTSAEPQNPASTTDAGTPACTDNQLKVSLKSAGVASGHEGDILVFTNTSSTACTVDGYPGAAVTDNPGQVVLNATRELSGFMSEGQYPTPHPIRLLSGATAATLLEWIDNPLHGGTPVGANCPGMDGGKLLITPPNTTKSTAFPPPRICVGYFVVYPLIPGTSGRLAPTS